jgi:hypothetical protein
LGQRAPFLYDNYRSLESHRDACRWLPYLNHGVHIITMKWGKVYELDVSEDSQAVAKALVKQAASGISEALAQKIEN